MTVMFENPMVIGDYYDFGEQTDVLETATYDDAFWFVEENVDDFCDFVEDATGETYDDILVEDPSLVHELAFDMVMFDRFSELKDWFKDWLKERCE